MTRGGYCRGKCLCLLLSGLLLFAAPTWACDVPVFRYALERWAADPYEVIVFHRGPLASEDQAAIDRLSHDASGESVRSNLVFRRVDVSAPMDEAMQRLWHVQSEPGLPWMVVRYAKAAQIEGYIWAGGLRLDAVETLLDSPIRREIARRILDGACAVWILLESGDREKDDAAAHVLRAQLKKMEEGLTLPVPSDGDVENREEAHRYFDAGIEFSMARLSRTDVAEQMLVPMLLHSEWDLRMYREPMAFPVFGRGRILYALVGKGINEDTIREACSFIVGACSCQIKDLSPGTDLLISVDWDRMLEDPIVESEPPPPVVGWSEFVEGRDAARQDSATMGVTAAMGVMEEVAAEKVDQHRGLGTLKRNILIVVLLGSAHVTIVSYMLKLRKR